MKRARMLGLSTLGIVLLVLLIVLLIGAYPGLGLHGLGHGPFGLVGLLLLVLVILLVMGKL